MTGQFPLAPPLCGPFRVELRVWDRDADALAGMAKPYKTGWGRARFNDCGRNYQRVLCGQTGTDRWWPSAGRHFPYYFAQTGVT